VDQAVDALRPEKLDAERDGGQGEEDAAGYRETGRRPRQAFAHL